MAMILVGGIQGATLVSLPSSSPSLSCVSGRNYPDASSHSLAARIPLLKGRFWRSPNRWQCRYSVTTPTDFLAEHTKAASLDSNFSASSGDSGISLKPAPRPVVKPPIPKTSSVSLDPSTPDGVFTSDRLDNLEDRNSLIESLDEVLEKAERLEKSKLSEGSGKTENGPVSRLAPSSANANSKRVKPQNPEEGKKAKTLKSVWRKGDTVSSVQKVKFVKDTPTSNKAEESNRAELGPQVSVRPADPPLKPQPQLQAKPSVAPPPLKRPVILKDVGAATKPPPVDDSDAAGKGKERKPILVDKFATKKKPVVDPLVAQAVLAPTKLPKGPPGKFKDDYKKKSTSASAPRRRIIDDDDDVVIPDEDTSELNVTIPGAVTARKGRKWSKASRKAARLQAAKDAAPVKVEILEVGEKGMLIEDLAFNLAISEGEILGLLYSKGIRPDGVQTLDKDMVKMVCKQYEVEVMDADPLKIEEMAKKKEIFDEEDLDKLEDRPPVLTIMGHVDHGKTTLLDYIRKSKVAALEAGGITQGIGAYKVLVPMDGKLQPCVFLDTPGHEAFGAMRARGARVTDIAIIVVAADDGIRPQTNEAIAHAKAAGVPIVIAINKIDKDGASPERVMQELSSIGLMPEDWGGDIPMVQISALKGENVDELLETTMLVAELQELKANPRRNAKGTVIEAGLHKAKGPTATFIVQNGTLKKGDVVVCGEAFGKVRALFDDSGRQVDEAGPSIPVQVIGLNNVPIAGDEFEIVDSLDVAREKAEVRAESLRNERISAKAGDGKVTLSSLASAVSSGKLSGLDLHQLNIVMKVDVQIQQNLRIECICESLTGQGSIEAIRQALQVLPQENVSLKFLLQAPGDISTSDVDLAVASKAIIIGFNVKAPGSVRSHADNKGVEIRLYRVIYELIDDVRNAMEGLLEPVEERETIGFAEVRAIFSSGSGRVAGCMVTEGKVVKGCGMRVLRNGKTVFVGVLDSLRRVKEAAKEVNAGLECGIGADDFDDWEEGDVVEAYNTVEKRRTLEEASASMAAALEEVGIKL